MGIYYVEIVDNECKELKKRFLIQKKIVINDFEKGWQLDGGGGGFKANLEEVYTLDYFFWLP